MSATQFENTLLLSEEQEQSAVVPGGRRRQRPTLRKIAVVAVSLVVFGVAWLELASPQLGGKASYVVTSGISMLPRYHAGDLVVLHSRSSYHVGEIAGYRNGELHEVVMHRIVAIRGDHYVFKGDNNSWADSFQPTKSQIVGAEWLHFSGGGKYLVLLRNPSVAAVLLGLLWLLSFGRDDGRGRRRAREVQGHGRDD